MKILALIKEILYFSVEALQRVCDCQITLFIKLHYLSNDISKMSFNQYTKRNKKRKADKEQR